MLNQVVRWKKLARCLRYQYPNTALFVFACVELLFFAAVIMEYCRNFDVSCQHS